LKVVIFVLAVLLGVEIAIRSLGAGFSAELRYLHAVPNRAKTMSQSKDFRILVLGNSLTNCGFNPRDFKMEMDSMGAGAFHVEIVALNGASVCEWSWLLKSYFWDHNRYPDLVIVNGSGKWQDEKDPKLERLALYMDTADILPLFSEDVTQFGHQMEFLQSYALRSYANKARVRFRVLSAIVPHYEAGMEEGNKAAQPSKHATGKIEAPKWTYRQMTRLVNGASQRHIPVILVDMPKERLYDLQADFPGAARSAGAEVVDCRDASSMLRGRFVDGHHMDESGASIFSRELARRLWAQFPHLLGRPGTNSPPIKRSNPN